jgi:hypothetical protein
MGEQSGIVVYYTMVGREKGRSSLKVPIAIRLDSSVGKPP